MGEVISPISNGGERSRVPNSGGPKGYIISNVLDGSPGGELDLAEDERIPGIPDLPQHRNQREGPGVRRECMVHAGVPYVIIEVEGRNLKGRPHMGSTGQLK